MSPKSRLFHKVRFLVSSSQHTRAGERASGQLEDLLVTRLLPKLWLLNTVTIFQAALLSRYLSGSKTRRLQSWKADGGC